jgi:hypothetical protein
MAMRHLLELPGWEPVDGNGRQHFEGRARPAQVNFLVGWVGGLATAQ